MGQDTTTTRAALTEVPGVGVATAETLVEHGFADVRSVAAADAGDLGRVPGFGPVRAAAVKAAAEALAGSGPDTPTTRADKASKKPVKRGKGDKATRKAEQNKRTKKNKNKKNKGAKNKGDKIKNKNKPKKKKRRKKQKSR